MNWHIFWGILGGGFALSALMAFSWAFDDPDTMVFRLIPAMALVVPCAACFGLAVTA